MILLWGLPGDSPLAAVHNVLLQLGYPVTFLDQRLVLDTEIQLSVGSNVEGSIKVCGHVIDLCAITAAYIRPYDSRRIPTIEQAGQDSAEWQHAISIEDILMSWTEITSALIVNRPTAMASNNSKPYQAAQIQSLGFETPDTLITTDPQAALKFWHNYDTVIYKSISGVRSIVSRLSLEHLERLNDISYCPTQFQQYISGDDYRVHVVGDEVFACRITSEADDYRYASHQGFDVTIQPYELPKECAERCRKLASRMELTVAGVDLRRTANDRWYCFEVNPSPGFTYYQEVTGQPIAEAIAKLLATA